MLTKTLNIAAHAPVIVVAFVVFFLGLVIGLQYNANLGTLLWLATGAIAALNVWWMFSSRAKAGR